MQFSFDYLLALSTYVLVSSMTPGPNNMMLLASGVNFGLRRTLPHMLGIGAGFALMVFLLGLGLAQVFDRWPLLHAFVKWSGVAYMLYLAWKIANSAAPVEGGSGSKNLGKPFSALQAALFQWLNPKAWAMALTAIATFVPQVNAVSSQAHLLMVCAVFWGLNLLTCVTWAGFGVRLRGWLSDPLRLRWFNWGMAAALIASIIPMLA